MISTNIVLVNNEMVKVTAAKAELTRQRIIDAAFKITLSEGFEAATFTRISQVAKLSRSGINTHYARKSDIAKVLVPLYVSIIQKPLDNSSTEAFYKSWVDAFENNPTFKAAVVTAGPIIPKLTGVKGLFDLIQGDPEQIQMCVYACVGYSVINA